MRYSKLKVGFLAALAAAALASAAHAVPFNQEVYVEEMTWPEIRERLKAEATTVIIPSGGTEQNGPHIVVGKHNFIVEYTSGEIARQLGNAMVAPVIAYVPEGRISPPEGHMRFPGTISVSETTFAAIIEDAARSFKEHGFRTIAFIGDHGGTQEAQQMVADKLNAEWRGQGVTVLNVTDYYKNNGQERWARSVGVKETKPAAHAGYFDTAEMRSIKPQGVRENQIQPFAESSYNSAGAAGNPTGATAEQGRKLLSLKVQAAVDQIRNAQYRRP